MDRFADVLDLARAHTDRETELRIAAIRAATRAGSVCSVCIDCGDPIHAERLKHVPNARRCAACQRAEESRRSWTPRGA